MSNLLHTIFRYCLTAVIFLQAIPLHAQSVRELQETHRKRIAEAASDTARVNRLIKYSIALFDVLPDSGYAVTHEALALSQKAGYVYGIARANQMIGQLSLFAGLYDSSRRAFGRALDAYRQINDSANIARVLTGFGYNYIESGKSDSAAEHFLAAIKMVPYEDSLVKAHPYNGLSLAFFNMGQHEKGLYYNRESGRMYALRKDTGNWIRMIINRGDLMEDINRLPDALTAYHEAMQLSDLKGDALNRYISRVGIGEILSANPAKKDSALAYLKAAEKISQTIQIVPLHQSTLYMALGKVYYTAGDFSMAEHYGNEALVYTRRSGQVSALMENFLLLTNIYIQLGKRPASLEALAAYVMYRDSLQKTDVATKVNELETKYRTLEKDKSLAEQQLSITKKDLEIRKTGLLITALAAGLILLMALTGGLYLHYRQKQQLQQQQLHLLHKESELAMTKATMEGEEKERARISRSLHDGAGATLSGVKLYLSSLEMQYRDLSGSTSYRDTLGLLNDAVAEIRDTSHNLMPRLLYEEGLDAAARAYCEKMGRNNALKIAYYSLGEHVRFHRPYELMIYRMLQELLGNVIKHAAATHVIVQLECRPDLFTLMVEDDGNGMSREKEAAGIGLYSIKTRVDAFQGYTDVQTSDEGTTVSLVFPVHLLITG
ncbi:tetratricopeptide repeat-containing sensor histidine kinase [Chitinophaga deserti]|uniref:tetratricopeptide repeat-containing sensor histidine kinase n=1 Tax=Chitinophaga deserti TaxID=2164099 RepID=UPI000D6AEC78|nr:ATP-binding protein [Chitinophaga deserti]